MKLVPNAAIIASLLLGLSTTACTHHETPTELNIPAIKQAKLMNLRMPEKNVFVSGQPTKAQFQAITTAGLKQVITLRLPEEIDWDEEAFVKALGAQYYAIPVAKPAGVNLENARRLHRLVDSLKTKPTLVHCGSSKRIGALVALYEAKVNGKNLEEAITEGKRWGLAEAEPLVRKMLSKE